MQIVFVIQAGELELKALLLGWSLRNKLGSHVRLVAACPQYENWGDLPGSTLALLAKLRIELQFFTPSFAPEYPIGNKIDALALLDDGCPALFLDSDMLCLESFSSDAIFSVGSEQQFTVAAKPADVLTWGSDQQWDLLRKGLGLPETVLRVRCTVDGKLSSPYYNAGFIATNHAQQLAQLWRDTCHKIRALPYPPEPLFPWLDQIGLAVCAQYYIARRITLSEQWNFPAHLRVLPARNGPSICHYHSPEVILREPGLLAVVRKAAASHTRIRQLLSACPKWQPLLRARLPQLRKKNLQQCDFLITGIPRSGTSLLCKLLSQQKNWLILNEPKEVVPYLQSRQDASAVALMHREYRLRVLLGDPIENKVRDGELVDDTAQGDQRLLYHPDVRGRFFRMGSKNTLAYLAALSHLQEIGWPVVAMVRHPLDSLASWENTFSHLRDALPQQLPLARGDFYGWAGWQCAALNEIEVEQEASLRRVLLWRMLARTIIGQSGVHVWRYEDLLIKPREHICVLRSELGVGGSGSYLAQLNRRQRNHQHSVHRDLLGDLCQPELNQLGYHL